MKKVAYSLIALLLAGCGQTDAPRCEKIKKVKWSNREQTIETYKNCIGDALSKSDSDLRVLSDNQIDSMLYLSYIYLTDTTHYDLDTARDLIRVAGNAITQKCKYAADNDIYQERYDNYCFIKEKGWADLESVEKFSDAIIVYQMALPCVYMDMLRENEQALAIIESYFGSTRDLNIPKICESFDGDKFIDLSAFFDADGNDYIDSINPADSIDGTIRFGIRVSKYHDLIYMLTHPRGFFKSDNLADVYVIKFGFSTDDTDGKVSASDMESKIYENNSAARGYEKLMSTLSQYYRTVLKMNADDADKYAHLAAATLMLQDIYINTTRYRVSDFNEYE